MKANTMRKRFGALALTLAMSASLLAGCGQKAEPAPAPAPEPAPEVVEPAPEPAPEPVVLPTMNDEHGNAAVGTNGAVSCNNELASQAGLDILQAGGNAVDAAVATAFAIGVVEPWLSGIGGCGMMNIYFADTKEFKVIEYMETLPNAELGWFNPDTDKKTAKNAAVPSQVAGLMEALEKYGTMTPEEVLAPAIKLAREGYPYNYYMHKGVVDAYDSMSEEALAIYTNNGIPKEEGDIVKNEPLAQTLEAIADDLLSGRRTEKDTVRDEILHTVACKAAIKAGWINDEKELLALVKQVMSREDLKYCPHGRPICISLSKKQLEKQFKRS